MSGRHGRPGPGRPRKPRFVVGTVLSMGAEDRLNRSLHGSARVLAGYLLKVTGAFLPGFGSVRRSAVLRAVGVSWRQLHRLRAAISPWVRTAVLRGGEMVVWSEVGANARRRQHRVADWWTELAGLERNCPGLPYLREARRWLESYASQVAIPEQSPVSSEPTVADVPRDRESGALATVAGAIDDWFPEQSSVSTALLVDDVPAVRESGVFALAGAASDEEIHEQYSVSTGTHGPGGLDAREFRKTCVSSVSFMSSWVSPKAEEFPVSTPRCHGTKQEERSKTGTSFSSAAPAAREIEPPPPSVNAREGGDTGPGAEDSDGGPVLLSCATETADQGYPGTRGAPPQSETRLRPAKEVTVDKEKSLALLAAIEAGEVPLPPAPRGHVTPERPARLGELPLGKAPHGPPPRLARGRRSLGEVTPSVLERELEAAMRCRMPEWSLIKEGRVGEANEAAMRELGRDYCRDRTVLWLRFWLEEQVASFVAIKRVDGYQPTGLVKHLAVKGAADPYFPEPEIGPMPVGMPARERVAQSNSVLEMLEGIEPLRKVREA